MSDDADDDVARYLWPGPHHMIAVPNEDPVAAHFVGPQHAPADHHALQAPIMMPNTAPAVMDVVERYQALPTIDAEHYQYHRQAPTMGIQPPQMLPPDTEQAYGLPEPPLATATAVDLDALPSFDAGRFHRAPAASPSLYDDQLVNDDGLAAIFRGIEIGNTTGIEVGNTTGDEAVMEVEPDLRPVEEELIFVPFVRGQLDCTRCRTVRELLHESANHKFYLVVHGGADHRTFHHAITDRICIDVDGQITTNEQMYLDLHQRTHHWVQSFMANCVEALRNDNSGQLKDSWSTFFCTNNISAFPAVNNDAHMELEIDMLKKILSTPSTNDEAAAAAPQALQAPQATITPTPQEMVENSQGDGTFNNANASWQGLNLPILDSSSNLNVRDGGPSGTTAEYLSQLAAQRKRIANMSMADAVNLLHMSREDAAKHLNISSSSLKRLCSRNGTHRWPARRINALNKKIKNLEEAAERNGVTRGTKEKLDELMLERAQLYASIVEGIRENEMKKGAGPSGSK